jgi:hypothetical protein
MPSTVLLVGSITVALCVGLFFGAMFMEISADASYGAIVQQTILFELLQTPADKRSDRILDLCFFEVSARTNSEEKNQFLTDEVIDHLEAKISDPAPVLLPNPREFTIVQRVGLRNCKLDYSIPSVAQPMGFDKELITFMQRVRDHKKKTANQDGNVNTCGERSGNAFDYDDELSARKAAKELGDVEKGLGSLPSF